MKERPILFSGPMVRAILSGQKTVTRRVVKGSQIPAYDRNAPVEGMRWSAVGQRHPRYGFCVFGKTEDACAKELGLLGRCPYGLPGDRLWVRETWSDVNLQGAPGIAYRADDDVRDLMEDESFLDSLGAFNYDDPRCKPYHFACWSEDLLAGTEGRWRPSIHMPRWASRILLEITAVRVERLQGISEQQALAEGVKGELCDHARQACADIGCWGETAKGAFGFLWESLNGTGSWAANPWVWVVEFKRVAV